MSGEIESTLPYTHWLESLPKSLRPTGDIDVLERMVPCVDESTPITMLYRVSNIQALKNREWVSNAEVAYRMAHKERNTIKEWLVKARLAPKLEKEEQMGLNIYVHIMALELCGRHPPLIEYTRSDKTPDADMKGSSFDDLKLNWFIPKRTGNTWWMKLTEEGKAQISAAQAKGLKRKSKPKMKASLKAKKLKTAPLVEDTREPLDLTQEDKDIAVIDQRVVYPSGVSLVELVQRLEECLVREVKMRQDAERRFIEQCIVAEKTEQEYKLQVESLRMALASATSRHSLQNLAGVGGGLGEALSHMTGHDVACAGDSAASVVPNSVVGEHGHGHHHVQGGDDVSADLTSDMGDVHHGHHTAHHSHSHAHSHAHAHAHAHSLHHAHEHAPHDHSHNQHAHAHAHPHPHHSAVAVSPEQQQSIL
eukprot:CAMPEP_0177659868 /NCGR_PEP_ID=MMETSP0447-20121125/17685_1 /TAXON_ID=0 /ORGANISM="Stygamoeba regulata, Strain BSH-02190019" /LENGTH=420 /DNA_ID=CAMNT_0019164793 /DNA_START=73 /DNA_END=1335 /DNA_ORIENTATION=+